MAVGGLLAIGMPVITYFVEDHLEAHCMSGAGGDLVGAGQAIGCGYASSSMLYGGTIFTIVGMVVTGVGAKLYANGHARTVLQTRAAVGTPAAYWLGWIFSGAAAITLGLWAGLLETHPDTLRSKGMQALLISSATASAAGVLTFAIGTLHASQHRVVPRVGVASSRSGKPIPTIGLAVAF